MRRLSSAYHHLPLLNCADLASPLVARLVNERNGVVHEHSIMKQYLCTLTVLGVCLQANTTIETLDPMTRTESLQSIQNQIARLKAKAAKLKRAEKPGLKQLCEVLRRYKLGLKDVEVALAISRQKRESKLRGRTVAPKYRNPDDKSETWTGRGRMPRWMTALIKKGKRPEDFLIVKG